MSLSTSSLLEHILYINLENRIDRKKHVLEEFDKLGVLPNVERVHAVKLENGAAGCTLSHIKCIELAKQRNWKNVFICEDDITFLNPSLFLHQLNLFENSEYRDQTDVIVICGNNCPPYKKCSEYCIQVFNSQTSAGYIVMQHYYDTLIRNMKEGFSQLLRDPTNKPQFALDMYWKRLQQVDKWYMIIPLTTTQYANHSDIENEYKDYTLMMTDYEKNWLLQQRHQMQMQAQSRTPPSFSFGPTMFYTQR